VGRLSANQTDAAVAISLFSACRIFKCGVERDNETLAGKQVARQNMK